MVTYSNILFCPNNIKPKDIQFTIIQIRENQQILIVAKKTKDKTSQTEELNSCSENIRK